MNVRSSRQSFLNSPFYSLKHTNYFDVYDRLLTKFIDKKITFVEIGILDGGSLFMWRDFLGEKARIIGIDLNPEATKWRDYGFEIFIGNQSNLEFWNDFFEKVGDIHVLLDDGGHRNDQQIITSRAALPHILDGGLIIIEDTQTSFMKFESFQKYTFVSYLKSKVKSLMARSDELDCKKDVFSDSVYSIEFFTGVCVLHINRVLSCSSGRIDNKGNRDYSTDFRYRSDGLIYTFLRRAYDWISWDHLSEARIDKHNRISSFLQKRSVLSLIRLVIVPCRFLIYFFLKLMNVFNLKKLYRPFNEN